MEKIPSPYPIITPDTVAYAVHTEDMSHLPGFAAFAQPAALNGLSGVLFRRREQRAAMIEGIDHSGFTERLTAASLTDIKPASVAAGVAQKPKASRPRDVDLSPDYDSSEQVQMTNRHRRNTARYWKKELERKSLVSVFGDPDTIPRRQSIWSYNAQKRGALDDYYNGQPYTPIQDLERRGGTNPFARNIEHAAALAGETATSIQQSPDRWEQQIATMEEKAAKLREKNKIVLIRNAQKAVFDAHKKQLKGLRVDMVTGRIEDKNSPAMQGNTNVARFEKPDKRKVVWGKRKIMKYLQQLP